MKDIRLLTFVILWAAQPQILTGDEEVINDALIVSKVGSLSCAEEGDSAEENCSSLMQDAADDDKDAFIYPASIAAAKASRSSARSTRQPTLATRRETPAAGILVPPSQTPPLAINPRRNEGEAENPSPPPLHPPSILPSVKPSCGSSSTGDSSGHKDCPAPVSSITETTKLREVLAARGSTYPIPVPLEREGNDDLEKDGTRKKRPRGEGESSFSEPPTHPPSSFQGSGDASSRRDPSVIARLNQTDELENGSRSQDVATRRPDNDAAGSVVATSGGSLPTVIDRDHPLPFTINIHSLLIVGIAGGAVAVVLVIFIIALCRCSTGSGGRNRKSSSPSSNKTDRGKRYTYAACNTLPPQAAPDGSTTAQNVSSSGSFSMLTDFHISRNTVHHPPPPPPQQPPHLAHQSPYRVTQLPLAFVSQSAAPIAEQAVAKATTKRDVKEWYV